MQGFVFEMPLIFGEASITNNHSIQGFHREFLPVASYPLPLREEG